MSLHVWSWPLRGWNFRSKLLPCKVQGVGLCLGFMNEIKKHDNEIMKDLLKLNNGPDKNKGYMYRMIKESTFPMELVREIIFTKRMGLSLGFLNFRSFFRDQLAFFTIRFLRQVNSKPELGSWAIWRLLSTQRTSSFFFWMLLIGNWSFWLFWSSSFCCIWIWNSWNYWAVFLMDTEGRIGIHVPLHRVHGQPVCTWMILKGLEWNQYGDAWKGVSQKETLAGQITCVKEIIGNCKKVVDCQRTTSLRKIMYIEFKRGKF